MSFLSDYRLYSSGNEAHPTWHAFAGLVTLSSIISRRTWIEQGYFNIFPNLYVVLVGEAGDKKTTASNIALKFLQELKNIPVSADSVTKEKLVEDMKAQEHAFSNVPPEWAKYQICTPLTIIASELSEFLGPSQIGMINFFTTIFGQDNYEVRTKNRGSTTITGCFLNLLGCTTPEWITTYLRSDIISGGFSRRALFVLEYGEVQRIAFPEVTDDRKAAWDRALAYARELQKLFGPMKWDQGAKDFYRTWYETHTRPKDDMVVGYYKSKHVQLLKIAMLISLSESTEMVLRQHHIEAGLGLLALIEEKLPRVFAGVGRNELNAAAVKVLAVLESIPKITVEQTLPGIPPSTPISFLPEKKLRGMMNAQVNQTEMDQILEHLKNTDRIIVLTSSGAVARSIVVLKSW